MQFSGTETTAAPPSRSQPPPPNVKSPPIKEKRTLKRVATGLVNLLSLRNMTRVKIQEPKQVKLENTYKMSPDVAVGFRPCAVTQEMETILRTELAGLKYDEKQCKALVLTLADHIKQSIKDMGYRRHKLVCNVVLGKSNDQGLQMCSRGLWDPAYDSWACANYKNDSIFAVATVHAFFVE